VYSLSLSLRYALPAVTYIIVLKIVTELDNLFQDGRAKVLRCCVWSLQYYASCKLNKLPCLVRQINVPSHYIFLFIFCFYYGYFLKNFYQSIIYLLRYKIDYFFNLVTMILK
jgi:hypothetical protein